MQIGKWMPLITLIATDLLITRMLQDVVVFA